MTLSSEKAITLFQSESTSLSSWVAINIVLPPLLRLKRIEIISSAFFGSRFPVGSSPMIISGSCISARAMAVRCSSHPESDSINFSFFERSPTCESTSGTRRAIAISSYPQTSIANATFSRTVFRGSSLKS